MMPQERVALAAFGLLALMGLGACAWRQQAPAHAAILSAQGDVWDRSLAASQRIDVNTASVAQLERLPGIGPALARRIVDDRQVRGAFRFPEDLARVKGVGRATIRAIAPSLLVSSASSSEPPSDASDGTAHQRVQ